MAAPPNATSRTRRSEETNLHGARKNIEIARKYLITAAGYVDELDNAEAHRRAMGAISSVDDVTEALGQAGQ